MAEKRKTELTIDQLRDQWLKHAADKSSLRDDEVRFERMVEFFGPERTVATIETTDVDELKEALADEEISQRSSGHERLGMLVSRYQAVGEDELIAAARKAERLKGNKRVYVVDVWSTSPVRVVRRG